MEDLKKTSRVIKENIRKKGIYICVYEDMDTQRAWITSLTKFDLTLDYIFLRHPYIATAVILIILGVLIWSIMFKIYKLELRNINLEKCANAYINDHNTQPVYDQPIKENDQFESEKIKVIHKIEKKMQK